MLKGIIFDFDGVIAESVQIKSDAFAVLYKPYGPGIVKKVVEHHEANGGMSRYEKFKIYHELFLNKTIAEEENSALANHFSDLTVENVIAAPYVRGALEFITKSYDKYKLFISTGMPTEEMEKILAGRKIANYFTDVFGSPAKKTVHVSNILNNYNLDPNELIFYGDSKTDLDAAKHANISFVLIKNKYNQTLSVSFRGKIINNFIGIL
jgi:phosphoglycolate phosphatase-like HAD superfamily hydrolase